MSLITGMDEITTHIEKQEKVIKLIKEQHKQRGYKIKELYEESILIKNENKELKLKIENNENKQLKIRIEALERHRDSILAQHKLLLKKEELWEKNIVSLKKCLETNADNINFKIGKEIYDIIYKCN
tara:strand:- start:1176 stop:1556 length:381 start_codon:yes stop_codon:yes gene_type:complete